MIDHHYAEGPLWVEPGPDQPGSIDPLGFQAEADRLSRDNAGHAVVVIDARSFGQAYWSKGLSFSEAASVMLAAANAAAEAAVHSLRPKGPVQ